MGETHRQSHRCIIQNKATSKKEKTGKSQDGGGLGRGDPFSPTNSSKEQLNADKTSQNNF